MSDDSKKDEAGWVPVIVVCIIVPSAFTYGGLWIGLAVLLVSVVALGWSKRHEGPFPTNKNSVRDKSFLEDELSTVNDRAVGRSNAVGDKASNTPAEPSKELKEWLERRAEALKLRSAIRNAGGHIQLKQSAVDPDDLDEPLRTEVKNHLKNER